MIPDGPSMPATPDRAGPPAGGGGAGDAAAFADFADAPDVLEPVAGRVPPAAVDRALGPGAPVAGPASVAGTADLSDLDLLFAVDSRFPGFGGAEAQAVKLAVALRERGARVEFVAPRVERGQPLADEHLGFRVTRIDYARVPFLRSALLMRGFARWLRAHAHRFDAMHVHVTHLLAATAGLVRDAHGLRIVTKVSGFYEFDGGVLDLSRRGRPLHRLLLRGLARVDRFQTISEQTREKLLAAGFRDEQILFVPNGIDVREPVAERPGDGTLRIGYCGRLREVKGVHVLLEAFALARAAHPERDLRLAIVGDGSESEALGALARELGVAERVEWLGRVGDPTGFYATLDLYVQPSFAEGLPNSVMEAMLAGRAVLATDVGGNRDLVEDGATGRLFPPGDAAALAALIGELGGPDAAGTRGALARAGRALIESRYAMDGVVDALADVYRGRA